MRGWTLYSTISNCLYYFLVFIYSFDKGRDCIRSSRFERFSQIYFIILLLILHYSLHLYTPSNNNRIVEDVHKVGLEMFASWCIVQISLSSSRVHLHITQKYN